MVLKWFQRLIKVVPGPKKNLATLVLERQVVGGTADSNDPSAAFSFGLCGVRL